MELKGTHKRMIKTFKAGTRYWRSLPQTASELWSAGYIKPTKFGMGNFMLTDKGKQLLDEIKGSQ